MDRFGVLYVGGAGDEEKAQDEGRKAKGAGDASEPGYKVVFVHLFSLVFELVWDSLSETEILRYQSKTQRPTIFSLSPAVLRVRQEFFMRMNRHKNAESGQQRYDGGAAVTD
ncbi:MAG: hypothetical protein ACXWT1_13420 [Methylobacter sp.]